MNEHELKALLLKATSTKYGIVVSTNSPDRLRQKLYPLRKQDALFANLTFIPHPDAPDEQLIIGVKQNVIPEKP